MTFASLFCELLRLGHNGLVSRAEAIVPVKLATKFELMINVRTAKAFGLTIPQALLVVADKVFECSAICCTAYVRFGLMGTNLFDHARDRPDVES